MVTPGAGFTGGPNGCPHYSARRGAISCVGFWVGLPHGLGGRGDRLPRGGAAARLSLVPSPGRVSPHEGDTDELLAAGRHGARGRGGRRRFVELAGNCAAADPGR